jgi:hypothetical protein
MIKINKNVNIKIKGFDLIKGRVAKISNYWILLNNIPTDYLIDGLILINLQKIIRIDEINDMVFNTILESKIKNNILDIELSIEDNMSCYNSILLRKKLIMISLHIGGEGLVGEILEVKEKYFILKLLSSEGIWEDNFKCDYEKVRVIELDTDYLKSLQIFIDFKPS